MGGVSPEILECILIAHTVQAVREVRIGRVSSQIWSAV